MASAASLTVSTSFHMQRNLLVYDLKHFLCLVPCPATQTPLQRNHASHPQPPGEVRMSVVGVLQGPRSTIPRRPASPLGIRWMEMLTL